MYQNLFDSHTHSENSLDGHNSVTLMVESGVEKGLQGLAVTDHCDCGGLDEHDVRQRLLLTAMDVAKAREAFRRTIILTSGMELGDPHLSFAEAERALQMHHYDFVLLGIHRLRDQMEFYDTDFPSMTGEELDRFWRAYFEISLECVQWGGFDALAHLGLPLRYLKIKHGIDADLHRHTDIIDEILRCLARGGKALELNTSGLRQGLGCTLPPAWILGRFRELGGELVTVGSDAHWAVELGEGIQDGMGLLLEAGFTHFTFYRDREPVCLRII